MDRNEILASLDAEIARLSQARNAIAGLSSAPRKRGRPAGSSSVMTSTPTRRTISAAGRKRIAKAQRARWAAQKKKAVAKAPTERTPAKKHKASGKKTGGKKAAKRTAKKARKDIAVKRIPPRKQVERKPKGPKKAPVLNALSGANGVVAVSPKTVD